MTFRLTFVFFLVWSGLKCSHSFIYPFSSRSPSQIVVEAARSGAPSPTSRSDAPSPAARSGAVNMILKSKFKELCELRECIKRGEVVDMEDKSHEDFYECMVSRFFTLHVAAEYNNKVKTGFLLGLPNPDIMSLTLRNCGAKCIVVHMDYKSGGVSVKEFARFTREQQRAKSWNPGPIAVVWHDFVIDPLQIELAASQGASAVTISPDLNTDADVSQHITLAQSLGVEPVVLVRSARQVDAALAAGARSFVMQGMDVQEQIALRQMYPVPADGALSDVVWGARLRASGEFSSIEEIDAAWALRDGGFNFIWPTSDSLYGMGMEDILSTVSAMKAKAAKELLSPRQYLMERKREGATEHLGDLAM